MSAILLEKVFPHLDGVVNGLTPVYRPEIPFRIRSVKDQGTRQAMTTDREGCWTHISGPKRDTYGTIKRYKTMIGLNFRVDVKATVDDAKAEGHDLAVGLMGDFIDTDRRGVVATTGIQALVVDPEADVTYSPIDPDQDGPTLAIVATIQFILTHGDC